MSRVNLDLFAKRQSLLLDTQDGFDPRGQQEQGIFIQRQVIRDRCSNSS